MVVTLHLQLVILTLLKLDNQEFTLLKVHHLEAVLLLEEEAVVVALLVVAEVTDSNNKKT